MKIADYYAWRGMAPDSALDAYLEEFAPAANTLLTQILESTNQVPLGELHAVLPPLLMPLAVIDDGSIACLVGEPFDAATGDAGPIVRYFLRDVPQEEQARLFDINARFFLASWSQELAARDAGLRRVLDEIGPAYEGMYLDRGRRPRDFAVRPIRIACQNVIVGLAAVAQDASFDGLSVVAWQTTEASHVATHEANRALAALVLCDAFQNGGTMEIRFDRHAEVRFGEKSFRYDGHPEGRVPASLRRFGRAVGIALGAEDRAAITPVEARQLFYAVTPYAGDLEKRAARAILELGITPERLGFTILAGVWKEIELDYLLASSARAASILEGGAEWVDRRARQAEQEACRAAHLTGMLHRRLSSIDSAGVDAEPRVVEDLSRPVTWRVDAETGSVEFAGWDPESDVPWSGGLMRAPEFVAYPRSIVTESTLAQLQTTEDARPRVLVVPQDVAVPPLPKHVVVLRCPDRLDDIDMAVEARLLTSRISRS